MSRNAMILLDWEGRAHEIEIVFTRLESGWSGYVVYIDGKPHRDGEMFATRAQAERAIRDYFAIAFWA